MMETKIQGKTKNEWKTKKRIRTAFICAMLFFPVLHFLIFNLFIPFDSFCLSFQRYDYRTATYKWAGLYNFERVYDELTKGIETTVLTHAIVNSLEYYVVQLFIFLPASIFCAFFFWRKMPGHELFKIGFLIPSLLPGVVLPMLYQIMLDSTIGPVNPFLESLGLGHLIPANGWLGDVDTSQSMVLLYTIWSGLGGGIILFVGNLNRLPSEIFESARIDGISLFKELTHLVIPMLWPVVSIQIITSSLIVFNVYIPPLMITSGGPNGRTMTIAYIIINWTQDGELTLASAAGLLFSAIGIPIIMFIKWGLNKLDPGVEF